MSNETGLNLPALLAALVLCFGVVLGGFAASSAQAQDPVGHAEYMEEQGHEPGGTWIPPGYETVANAGEGCMKGLAFTLGNPKGCAGGGLAGGLGYW